MPTPLGASTSSTITRTTSSRRRRRSRAIPLTSSAPRIEKQVAIIGTPDDAIREIERVRHKLGGFGAVLLFGNDLAPWPAQQRSFELIAEFVKPHFARANAAAPGELRCDGAGHRRVPPNRARSHACGDASLSGNAVAQPTTLNYPVRMAIGSAVCAQRATH